MKTGYLLTALAALPRKDMQAHVLVFLPRHFERQRLPVILYLHGAAQRGKPAHELRNTAAASRLDLSHPTAGPAKTLK